MKNLAGERQRLCLLVIAILIVVFLIIDTTPLFAQLNELEKTAKAANLGEETELPVVIGKMVQIAIGMMSLILVILLIIGGVMWMTSGGKEDQVKRAKDLIKNALIGLVIVVIAYTLAHFVTREFAKVTK